MPRVRYKFAIWFYANYDQFKIFQSIYNVPINFPLNMLFLLWYIWHYMFLSLFRARHWRHLMVISIDVFRLFCSFPTLHFLDCFFFGRLFNRQIAFFSAAIIIVDIYIDILITEMVSSGMNVVVVTHPNSYNFCLGFMNERDVFCCQKRSFFMCEWLESSCTCWTCHSNSNLILNKIEDNKIGWKRVAQVTEK